MLKFKEKVFYFNQNIKKFSVNTSCFCLFFCSIFVFSSCKKADEDPALSVSSRFLYVASGSCYSGNGNTTFSNVTSSNLVYRLDIDSGAVDTVLADYNSSPAQPGDSPVGLGRQNAENVYVLVENTTTAGARRVDLAPKAELGERTLFSNNTTALSTNLRSLAVLPGGDLLIAKSTAVEKITSANARITKGTNAYVNAPAAPCATSTTLMTKTIVLSNDFIVFAHAAAGQNRIGFVKPEGYGAPGDCTQSQAAPNANSFPTSLAYDRDNKVLFVSYAGNATTTDINSIYAYTLNEAAGSVSISATNKIYDASLYGIDHQFLLYGISEMAYDSIDKKLFVATAINTATTVVNYNIEKLNYDFSQLGVTNKLVLTRSSTAPFKAYGGDTKCISALLVD